MDGITIQCDIPRRQVYHQIPAFYPVTRKTIPRPGSPKERLDSGYQHAAGERLG